MVDQGLDKLDGMFEFISSDVVLMVKSWIGFGLNICSSESW